MLGFPWRLAGAFSPQVHLRTRQAAACARGRRSTRLSKRSRLLGEALEPRMLLAGTPKILFLGNDAGATFGADPAVMSHLTSTFGAQNVAYKQASAANNTTDLVGIDVLVLSSTPASGTLRNKYHTSPVGILNWEEAVMDNAAGEFGLATAVMTKSVSTTQLTIAQNHPITAGLSGTIQFLTASGPETLSTPSVYPGLTTVATAANGVASTGGASVAGNAAIFIADAGQPLDPASGASPAAGRRVMFPMTDNTFNSLTSDGRTLFTNAINWLANMDTAATPPVMLNGSVSSIDAVSAVYGGEVADTGGEGPTVTVYYGTTDGGTNAAAWQNSVDAGLQFGTFSLPLSNLQPSTTYYVTIRGVNSAGEHFAEPSLSFTTAALSLPAITANDAANVTSTSAELSGQITSTGNAPNTVTLYYGDNDAGAVAANWDNAVSLGTQPAAFGTVLAGLAAQTTHYFRFRATNAAGDAWTATGSFATLSQSVDDVVAFNDHVAGPATHPSATTFAANGVASGLLKNIATGAATGITLSTSAVGINYAGASGVPAAGTDAANIFAGFVDFSTGTGTSLELDGADTYTHAFTGLDPNKTYDFAGTAVRGNTPYTRRWTLVTLVGADSFTPAHSAGIGIVTAGLAANQVAVWTGSNHLAGQGFVAQWLDIDAGADGRFDIVSTQYTGTIPTAVDPIGAANDSKGYALTGVRLREKFTLLGVTSITPAPGARTATPPTTATVNFNLPVLASSVAASDLTVNGVPATAVNVVDADTLAFTLPAGLAAGVYTLRISPGALESTDNRPNAEFTSQFTIVAPATVTNAAPTDISGTSARIGAYLVDGGDPANVTIYWGDNDGRTVPSQWDNTIVLIDVPSGEYTELLTGLLPATDYYYRTRAINVAGLAWSPSTQAFTTLAVSPPTVENAPATNVGPFSAQLAGRVANTGNDTPTVTIFYGPADGGENAAAWQSSVDVGLQSGAFAASVTGLTPEATYYFRALGTNLAGSAWATTSESFTTATAPTLRISEFMADNGDTLTTRTRATAGDAFTGGTLSPDWIEIRNFTPSPINVGGLYLTDDPDTPAKWQIPGGTTIPASGYLVVFASGLGITDPALDERGYLHANFSLQNNGEYLALVGGTGVAIHEFVPEFPRQVNDVSYGLDDLGAAKYYNIPTPGAANNESSTFTGFVADTRFSADRGYYDAPFSVTITSNTPGATLVYTTNGSLPTPTNGTQVPSPDANTPPSATVAVNRTTTLRAMAFKPGLAPTNVDTQTYLFVDDVINQPIAPTGFPTSWNGTPADYEFDPQVTANAANLQRIRDGFDELPALSLVFDPADIVGAGGLYTNPLSAQEKPTSAELIFPDGTVGFQIDAGARMQGGASRNPEHGKHSMSLRFRNELLVGANNVPLEGDLEYPLFDGSPVERFDSVHLRARYNNSWIHWDQGQRNRGDMIREMWARDTMRAMGDHSAGYGRYVHLYLNGLYWGVYEMHERAEASHYAAYFGGTEDDYDARNGLVFTDGNATSWNELAAAVAARNWDAIQQRLDVDNYIDWFIMHRYGGNQDLKNDGNWRAVGGGPNDAPWRLYAWDVERILENVSQNAIGPSSDPTGMLASLLQIEEFRVRFGDRIHKHLFNAGALTPANTAARWMQHAATLDNAIVAESARWGDLKQANPLTRDVEWIAEQNRLLNTYFPFRTNNLLTIYRNEGLYPAVAAPTFSQHGGTVQAGFDLAITAPAGTRYYTTDGSDPRLPGGAVSPSAIAVTGDVTLAESGTIRSRVLSGGTWSALTEAFFAVESPLRVSEIYYNPPGAIEDTEFLELVNTSGTVAVDMADVSIEGVGEFAFAETDANRMLAPLGRIVVAKNPAAFAAAYPLVPAAAIAERGFTGALDNAGETITLRDKAGGLIHEFAYDDDWYKETDGDGFSLVVIDPSASYGNPANWRSSARIGGSPGADDPAPLVGDFNGDGLVDRLDAALLAQNFGSATGAHRGRGDINGDGATNLADLAALQTSLGTAAPSPASSSAAGAVVVRSRRIEREDAAATRRDVVLGALDSRCALSHDDAGFRLTATRRSVAGRTRLVVRAVDSLIDRAAR